MESFEQSFGLIVVAPLWGMISTMLFLRSWVALIRMALYAIGLAKGHVARKKNISGITHAASLLIIYLFALALGFWFSTRPLPFEWEKAEKVVYWLFCALAAFYILPRIPDKLRKTWRYATVPGALEEEAVLPEETVITETTFAKSN